MKRGTVLINAYTARESELYQPKRIREELERMGVTVEIRRNFLSAYIADGQARRGFDADFCVYLDKDRYAGELMERTGMRLFNRSRAVAVCDDKAATFSALAGHGIPMPDTLPAPLCYTADARPDEAFLEKVAEKLGFPLVAKECYGSLGSGVSLVNNHTELLEIEQKLLYKPHLYQRFIQESAGRDVRVTVVGGKAICAMLRTSAGDFRSNLGLGGQGVKYPLDEKMTRLCEEIARILELDYCGVDLLFHDSGFCVCEVNSNAFFRGSEEVTKTNVAKAYARHIYREIYGCES